MRAALLIGVLALSTQAFAAGKSTVIAKYGNFYKGDDDMYAQCLILSNGKTAERQYIYQGLSSVDVETKSVSAAQLAQLEKVRRSLPSESTLSKYEGYNFLVISETSNSDPVDVLGQAPGAKDNKNYDQYFTTADDSEAAKIVKSICAIDGE